MENVINHILTTHKISLRQMARDLGYGVTILSLVVNRKRPMSTRMAVRIATVYNMDVGYIMEVEGIE